MLSRPIGVYDFYGLITRVEAPFSRMAICICLRNFPTICVICRRCDSIIMSCSNKLFIFIVIISCAKAIDLFDQVIGGVVLVSSRIESIGNLLWAATFVIFYLFSTGFDLKMRFPSLSYAYVNLCPMGLVRERSSPFALYSLKIE